MESNLKRPGGGTIAAGNRNSPPGRLRPKGSVEFRVRAPLSPRTFFYFRALPSKSTLSSHSSSALSPLTVCRRHLSLIWVRNNLRVRCWRGCCAGCKHSARPPPHPILGNNSKCFWSFSVTVFGKDFFMVFHAFHLPFFNAFSMNFRCISHHFF